MKKTILLLISLFILNDANALSKKQTATVRIAAKNTNACIKYYAKTKNITSLTKLDKHEKMKKLIAYESNLLKLIGKKSKIDKELKKLPKYRVLKSREKRCSDIAKSPIKALNLKKAINTNKFNKGVIKTLEQINKDIEKAKEKKSK